MCSSLNPFIFIDLRSCRKSWILDTEFFCERVQLMQRRAKNKLNVFFQIHLDHFLFQKLILGKENFIRKPFFFSFKHVSINNFVPIF